MAKKIKLHNIGQRTILTVSGEFKPNTVEAFEEKEAAKLLKLFKSEVQDLAKASAHLEADDDQEGWEFSTAKEIQAFLDSLDIAYKPKASKAVFVAIAEAVEADDDANDVLEALTVKELQEFLTANDVEFETDANEPRLIELGLELIAVKTAE